MARISYVTSRETSTASSPLSGRRSVRKGYQKETISSLRRALSSGTTGVDAVQAVVDSTHGLNKVHTPGRRERIAARLPPPPTTVNEEHRHRIQMRHEELTGNLPNVFKRLTKNGSQLSFDMDEGNVADISSIQDDETIRPEIVHPRRRVKKRPLTFPLDTTIVEFLSCPKGSQPSKLPRREPIADVVKKLAKKMKNAEKKKEP